MKSQSHLYFTGMKTAILSMLFVFSLMTVVPNISFAASPTAQDDYTLLAPLPCIQGSTANNGQSVNCPQGNGNIQTSVSFKQYVQYAINLAIGLAAVAAVFMIVWGGFNYVTSTVPALKSDGKEKIQNAVMGLVLILASYLILQTIDPRLVDIPSTLVPKIVLKCSTNPKLDAGDPGCNPTTPSIGSYYNQAASQVTQNAVQNHELENQINTDQQKVDDLDSQIKDLQNQLDPNNESYPDDATVQDIKKEIANLTNQENDLKGNILTNQTVGLMNERIQTCVGPDKTDSCFSSAKTDVNALADQAEGEAAVIGKYDIISSDIENKAASSLQIIQMERDVALMTSSAIIEPTKTGYVYSGYTGGSTSWTSTPTQQYVSWGGQNMGTKDQVTQSLQNDINDAQSYVQSMPDSPDKQQLQTFIQTAKDNYVSKYGSVTWK